MAKSPFHVIPRRSRYATAPFILKARVVDIGQGDGAIVETPDGDLLIIDGGKESHMRLYISASFVRVLDSHALDISAVIVTHGDADRYERLPAGKDLHVGVTSSTFGPGAKHDENLSPPTPRIRTASH